MGGDVAARIQENEAIKSFIAHRDADIVNEACTGLGTDDEQLIKILCCRTKAQLERIDQAHRKKYTKALWEKVEGDVSGNYKKIVRYALMERHEFVSHIIDEACSGLGTKESLLVEVLAPLSNAEIAAAKKHWEAKKDKPLVDKLNSELSGGLKELIVGLLTGKRAESNKADEALADKQATQLFEAGVGKFVGTDDEVFIDIIGKSPSVQIQAIKAKYEKTRGMSLHKAISKEFRGDLQTALQCMLEPPVDFYCATIKSASTGLGTNEAAICRVLGGNDKKQLAVISDRFKAKYDMALSDMVKTELGGRFKDAVLAWLTAADPTNEVEQQLAALPKDQDEKRLKLLEAENDNMKRYIARTDAEQIRRACKGFGTNESLVMDIICSRTKSQVERIDQAYREMFKMTLREQLESDLSGELKTFMVYTQMETQEFDALLMKQAMASIGTEEDIIIMLLTTRDNAAIAAALKFYQGRFDESLVDKISSETSGAFRDLLLVLLKGQRDESAKKGDEKAAQKQAEKLQDAADKNAAFVEILAKSSRAQVACIRKAYEDKFGCSLQKTIEKKFLGNMEDALVSLLFDPIENFARGLKVAFNGLGTDEDAVCRILGGNDKQTCRLIAERFKQKYDQALVDVLKSEIRGTFLRATVAWVSAVDPAADKEGFQIATEAYVEEVQEAGEEEEWGMETPRKGGPDKEEDDDEKDDEQGEAGKDEEVVEVEVEVEEEEEEEDEEDPKEDKKARKERLAAKKAIKKEKMKRMKARMVKAKRKAAAEKKRKERERKMKMFAQRVKRMAKLSREQVAFAKARYGSEVVDGLTVWGKWDSEMYMKHNEDIEGEHGWSHFRKSGFSKGRLLRIDNDFGGFVGVLDMSAYVDKHKIDASAVGKRGPFEKPLVGFKHYVQHGSDAGLDIAITQVVPIYLLGDFHPRMYMRANNSAKPEMALPRAGKFDEEGYRKLHPEMDAGMKPFEHFKANRRGDICVRGRTGQVNRKWYKRKYQKKFNFFFKEGYRKGQQIKVKGKKLTPLEHFVARGFKDGRKLRMKTGIGLFEGTLNMGTLLKLYPAAGEAGTAPLEYYKNKGKDAGVKLPLTNIELRRVDATCIHGDKVVAGVEKKDEDEGGDDDDDESEADGDDDDDGDDGDDGDD